MEAGAHLEQASYIPLYFYRAAGWCSNPRKDLEQGGLSRPIRANDSKHFTGLNFKIERQLIAVERITDPSVVQLANGRWLMALSQGTRTLLADSDDGYEFDLTGVVVELGGIPELAALSDGNVRLYVSAEGIKSVVSGDEGQTWAVEPGTRLSSSQGEILADPSLIMTSDGRWVLFYKVAPPPTPHQSG